MVPESQKSLPLIFTGEKNGRIAVDAMEGEPSPNVPKGLGFHWSGWIRPTNQEAVIGHVIHAGNFVVENPRYNGKLTGITGI